MTLPISTDKLMSGSGIGGVLIIILLMYLNPTGEGNFSDLDKRIDVHAASAGHKIALQNDEELKNELITLKTDFKNDFRIINEKLNQNYRLLCQISNGNCK